MDEGGAFSFYLNNFALEGDSFQLKIPIDIQMKSLILFPPSVLKVWRSALLHRVAWLTSLRQERPTCVGVPTLCWMKRTECWTWDLNPKFVKLLTRSGYVNLVEGQPPSVSHPKPTTLNKSFFFPFFIAWQTDSDVECHLAKRSAPACRGLPTGLRSDQCGEFGAECQPQYPADSGCMHGKRERP